MDKNELSLITKAFFERGRKRIPSFQEGILEMRPSGLPGGAGGHRTDKEASAKKGGGADINSNREGAPQEENSRLPVVGRLSLGGRRLEGRGWRRGHHGIHVPSSYQGLSMGGVK